MSLPQDRAKLLIKEGLVRIALPRVDDLAFTVEQDEVGLGAEVVFGLCLGGSWVADVQLTISTQPAYSLWSPFTMGFISWQVGHQAAQK